MSRLPSDSSPSAGTGTTQEDPMNPNPIKLYANDADPWAAAWQTAVIRLRLLTGDATRVGLPGHDAITSAVSRLWETLGWSCDPCSEQPTPTWGASIFASQAHMEAWVHFSEPAPDVRCITVDSRAHILASCWHVLGWVETSWAVEPQPRDLTRAQWPTADQRMPSGGLYTIPTLPTPDGWPAGTTEGSA